MVVAAIFVSVGLVVVGAVIVGVGVHVSVAFALVVSVRVFVLVLVSILEHVRVPGSFFVRVLLAGHVSFALPSMGIFVGVISINVGVVVVDNHSVHFVSVGSRTVEVFITMVVSLVRFVRFALLSVGIVVGFVSINVGMIMVDNHSIHFVSVASRTVEVFISMFMGFASFVSFALLSVGVFVSVISINVGVVVVDDHSVHFMSVGGCTVKVFISMVVSLVGFVRQGCGEREGQKGENNTSAKSQHFFIIQIFCLVKKREIQRERETEGETEELFKKEIVDDGNVNGR